VVRYREGFRLRGIEQLAVLLATHPQPTRLPQRTVDVYGHPHRRDSVFGQHNDSGAVPRCIGNQSAGHGVNLAERYGDARMFGAEPLQVVIEVRQVNERQRRDAGAAHVYGSLGNPARRSD
jgi:hypothetical protein